MCERPGSVVIPDRTLTWFDLESKQLKAIELPGRTFDVAAIPQPTSATAEAPNATASRSWLWLVLVVVGVGCWWVVVGAWPWWKQFHAHQARSEPAYFVRFLQMCHAREPHAIAVSLLNWLERAGPLSLDEFGSRYGDAELTQQLAALSEAAFGRSPPSEFKAHDLLRGVSRARLRLLRESKSETRHRSALPQLNP